MTLSETASIERIEYPTGRSYKFQDYGCVEIFLSDSGEVKVCAIEKAIKVKGHELPLNAHLCFDKAGKPSPTPSPTCVTFE